MLAACLVAAWLGHPAFPIAGTIADPLVRRAVFGVAMGATAVLLITSIGTRSGGHFNPSVTLTYLRLGTISRTDAAGYVLSQTLGGLAGVGVAVLLLGADRLGHPAVHYVVTAGAHGPAVAFVAEVAISFALMGAILTLSNVPALNRLTPFAAGSLIAVYITFEAPLSGMSMNPARTLASAAWAGHWTALWIYLTAPPLGMLLAAEAFHRASRAPRVLCGKLRHDGRRRCIFRCTYPHDATAAAGGAR
jgi:aquaporin Z